MPSIRTTHHSLRFFDVFVSEEELSVEVAQVDRIEVDDMNFTKASKNKIL